MNFCKSIYFFKNNNGLLFHLSWNYVIDNLLFEKLKTLVLGVPVSISIVVKNT